MVAVDMLDNICFAFGSRDMPVSLYAADQPAIDSNDRSGDVGSAHARKESDRISILFGVSIAPHGDCARAFSPHLFNGSSFAFCLSLIQKADAIRGDAPRQNNIDGNPVARYFVR
jgi:hypothetical protein